jgi:hypothetical protein
MRRLWAGQRSPAHFLFAFGGPDGASLGRRTLIGRFGELLGFVRSVETTPTINFPTYRHCLRFLLQQPTSDHLLRHSPLAIKLVAFGECAVVQSIGRCSHTSMNERSAGLDDDRDLIAVTVTEPVEGRQGNDLGRVLIKRPAMSVFLQTGH